MNIELLSAYDILKISNPCVLFEIDIINSKNIFKSLIKKYHPDKNHDENSNEVFIHIHSLYKQYNELMQSGRWELPNTIFLTDERNTKYKINFGKKRKFELGMMYISKTVVVYVLESGHKKFYDNYLRNMKNFKFANDNMKKEFERYLPKVKKNFKCLDGKYAIIIEKTSETLLLQDVYEHFNVNGYPKEWDKHVAWITSRLYNLLAFLKYSGIVSNSISLETIFISPEHHTIMIYGGWWYSTKIGEKMIAVPSDLYNVVPPTILATKKANITTDGEFVRALGRKLLEKVKAPKPFTNWLNYSATEDVLGEYEKWQNKILKESYGERKFVKLNLSWGDIYDNP